MSPALNFQALGLTEPQNIFVQFDYCRWDGEQDDIVVTAENAGSMPETQLVKDHPKRTWQSIVFKVTDATSETRIKISGTKAGSNRFFIDNFRVYVSQAVPVEVTSKLETPTNLSCTEQTPSSLSFTWKRDYDASSYTAELYRADNESVAVKSETVSGNQCTFDELDPSADYKFRVMANCQPKPEFNSDYSAFLACRTLDPVPVPAPQVSLYEASRGFLVFEWPRDDTYPRKFILELAETASGDAIRTVECKEPVKGQGFYANYPYNRFVFGNLEADQDLLLPGENPRRRGLHRFRIRRRRRQDLPDARAEQRGPALQGFRRFLVGRLLHCRRIRHLSLLGSSETPRHDEHHRQRLRR